MLDIETAPHLAYTWGLWKQNIAISQIDEAGYVLCWAAKWLGEDVQFASIQNKKSLLMLDKIHRLLDQADAVVHYNGKRFDIPTLNREFLTHGMLPPSPYKQIDLLQTAKSQFKFASNKMDFLLQQLKIGEKVKTDWQLWLGCMKGDKSAWEKMRQYNIGDVVEMEKLYLRLRPWIKGHPNPALFSADKEMCPTCGSHDYQHRGYARTGSYIYKRYQCKGCGKWFRGTKNEGGRQVQHVAAA